MATEITVADLVAYLKLKDTASPAIKEAAKRMVDAANGVGNGWDAAMKKTATAADKAEMRMLRAQEAAIKMNQSLFTTNDSAQLLAGNINNLSSTTSSLGKSLGASSEALNVVNSTGEVTALVMGKMTTATIGFNAATIGVIGAAGALGVALGGFLRDIGEGENFLGLSTKELDANIARLVGTAGKLKKVEGEQAAFTAKIAAINAQAKAKQALAGPDPVFEAAAADAEKRVQLEKKVEDAVEKRLAAQMRGWEKEIAATKQGQAILDGLRKQTLDAEAAESKARIDRASDTAKRIVEAYIDGKKKEEDAAIKAAEIKKKFDEAELAARERQVAHMREMAGVLFEIGQTAGGAFGEVVSAGGAALQVLANLKDQTLQNASAWEKVAGAIQGAFAAYKSGSVLGGAATGAMAGAAFGVPGAIIGGLAGGILGFLGGKSKAKEEAAAAKKEMDELYRSFVQAAGGLEALKRRAAEAGVSLENLFQAKNAAELKGAIDGINRALGLVTQATDLTNEAMEKYGITIDQMGEKFAKQELDKQAGQLYQEYTLLTEAGADVALVNEKMADNINKYLQTALRAGVTIPESMKPILQALVDQGLLVDEAGQKFETLDGVTFGESTSAMEDLVAVVRDLVEALRDAFNLSSNLNTSLENTPLPNGGNIPKPPPGDDGFAEGGYVPPVPGGRRVTVGEGGEGEYIIPESMMGQVRGGPAGHAVTFAPTYVNHLTSVDPTDVMMDKLMDRIRRNTRGDKERLRNILQERVT